MLVQCEGCGKDFNKPKSHVERVAHIYCSTECHNKAQTKYEPKNCVICGEPFRVARGSQGKYSTCDNPVCRQAKKAKQNNPNWRGGVTKSRKAEMSTKAYKLWRLSVFERDKYTCQMCGQRGGDLQADHIKPWAYFPELRYDINNGRTLCEACHVTTYKDVFKWRNTTT